MDKILYIGRWFSYITLLIVDLIITILSMCSLDIGLVSVGLGIIGGVFSILLAYLFLTGIRAKNIEKVIKLNFWLLGVILIVLLNWSYTTTTLRVQSEDAINQNAITLEDTTYARITTKKQIDSLLKQVDTLSNQQAKLNQWQTKSVNDLQSQINSLNNQITLLQSSLSSTSNTAKIEVKQEIVSMKIFAQMGSIFSMDAITMSKWWWLLAFILLQVFSAIAAPKLSDDNKLTENKNISTIEKMLDTDVYHWIDCVWEKYMTNTKIKLPTLDHIQKWMVDNHYYFNSIWHSELYTKAIELKLVSQSGTLIVNHSDALNKFFPKALEQEYIPDEYDNELSIASQVPTPDTDPITEPEIPSPIIENKDRINVDEKKGSVLDLSGSVPGFDKFGNNKKKE